MKKTFWLLACFCFCLAASCNKNTPEPAFKNSFSCKIDGVFWEPAGGSNATGGINTPEISVGKLYGLNEIGINVLKRVINESGARIVFEGFVLSAYLEPNINRIIKRGSHFYNFNNNCSDYYPDSIPTNIIKVTLLDTLQKRVSGVFEFEAISPTCRESIKVTEGKFNVQY